MALHSGRLALAMAVVATAVCAGCGGDDGSGSFTVGSASRDEALATVKDALTSPDATHVCRDLMTTRFVDENFGDVDRCEAREEPTRVVDAAIYRREGRVAAAMVLMSNSSEVWQSGPGLFIELKYGDGSWRLDSKAFGSTPGG